jgi:ribokinase
MKILNFGSCNIDYVYSLDHIVRVGETETTHKLEVFPGGKGLNQSIALSRAGAQVYHAGCIGTDGTMLMDILKESGVKVSYVQVVDAKNGHAIIQVNSKGDNSIFLYPGSNEMITEKYVDDVLADFTTNDIILLQNEINKIDYIIEKAYDKGMQIVLNPSPFNEKVKAIDLNKISYLILNEVEAFEYSGYEDPRASLDYFKNNFPCLKVMLTLGSNGCVYMDAEQEIYHSIFDVTPVDTTAAGDTFTGYFIEGVSRNDDYKNILKIASAASAIAVSRNGAAPSIPLRNETLGLMGTMVLKKT